MLSNAYFLAKFRFDTAENEPANKLQKIAINHQTANFANFPNCRRRYDLRGAGVPAPRDGELQQSHTARPLRMRCPR